MAKILWVDTETTGISAYKNGVIQISGFVEINGKIKEEFDLMCAPYNNDKVDAKALEVNQRTLDEIMQFPRPELVYQEFSGLLGKYVNKFNKADKFIMAGYNVGFDADMLQNWFRKSGDRYFYSYFFGGKLDVMAFVMHYCAKQNVDLPNHKLGTIADHLGFDANFHNALDDIRVTRDIYLKLIGE